MCLLCCCVRGKKAHHTRLGEEEPSSLELMQQGELTRLQLWVMGGRGSRGIRVSEVFCMWFGLSPASENGGRERMGEGILVGVGVK